MTEVSKRPAARILPLVMLGAGLAACEADSALGTIDMPPEDRVIDPTIEPTPSTATIIESTLIREDFDSKMFVDSGLSSVALIDTNRGIARLPRESFPALEGTDEVSLDTTPNYEGVLEAANAVIDANTTIDAKDSAEIRAADTIRVSGRLRAGKGGVTLIAGKEIRVDGSIESQGPIRLRVADEEGLIQINGTVATLANAQEASSDIRIVTRGEIQIGGELSTGESREASTGKIELISYGDIRVSGDGALVTSGPSLAASSGRVLFSTESDIVVESAAVVSVGFSTVADEASDAGELELRATGQIIVRSGATIEGGESNRGPGGLVFLAALESVQVDGAMIVAKEGSHGGMIQVDAGMAIIGPNARLEAGAGERSGGTVEIGTSGDSSFLEETQLVGGDTGCGDGGDVSLRVGGRLEVATNVAFIAGNASATDELSCVGSTRGGNVDVTAQDGSEELIKEAAQGGFGSIPGLLELVLDKSFTRPIPDVRVRTEGWIVSKIFDRGEGALGTAPFFVDAEMTTPQGTFAKVQIAGTTSPDGEFNSWADTSKDQRGLLDKLAGDRFFRYRVWLKGRALDSPEVDFFEINLAP